MAFEAGQLVGNRYRILRHTSSGGMSATYLAEDALIRGRQVAIETRQLSPGLHQQQIQREILLLRDLNHPNIRRLLDFGSEADTPYLVFEYAPNGTLRYRHPRGSKVPLPTVIGYVTQIANALHYLHDQGIIHRDVKPENMLLGNDGKVLLSNFEIAVTYPGTTADSIAGTARYMAPEQFRGEAVPASDQYSLGVVVYEWLCGRPPFTEGDFMKLAYQHHLEPPPPLTAINPTIPRDVEQVVMIALEKDPQSRFRNMRAFARAFEQASIPPIFDLPTLSFQPPAFAQPGSMPAPQSMPAPFGASPVEKTKASLEGEDNDDVKRWLPDFDITVDIQPPAQARSNEPNNAVGPFTRVGDAIKNLSPSRGQE